MINRVWHLLIVLSLLAAVVVAGHLVPGLSGSFVDVDIRNSLHIVGFAGVAAIVFELVPQSLTWKSVSALVFVIVLGFLAEIVQWHARSEFNGLDIARDAAGAGVYVLARLIWSRSENRESGKGRGMIVRIVAVIVGSLVLTPLYLSIATLNSYQQRMPVIVDFSWPQDVRMLKAIESNISIGPAVTGAVAEIELLRRGWSGVLIDTVDPDWSAYRHLVIRMAMTAAPKARVSIELSDGEHPGYRSQHLIGGDPGGPDFADYRFPLRGVKDVPGRPDLDLTNIDLIYVIGKSAGETSSMFIEEIRLE